MPDNSQFPTMNAPIFAQMPDDADQYPVNPMVTNFIHGLVNTVAGPGKLAAPNPYPAGSEEANWYEGQRQQGMQDWSRTAAPSFAGLSAPFAEANAAGVFGGKLARTANLDALKVAEKMGADGAYPDEIHQATGWFRGTDGQWRFEIPDAGTGFTGKIGDNTKLGDVYNHPALYDAYPQLRDTEIMGRRGVNQGSYSGSMDGEPGAISIGDRVADPRSTTLHEIQHAIQEQEGFAPGANGTYLKPNTPAWDIYAERIKAIRTPMSHEEFSQKAGYDGLAPAKDYKDYVKTTKNPPDFVVKAAQEYAAKEAYRRSAGEVEARAVQARKDFTPDQIRDIPPPFNYDVPADMQIVSPTRPPIFANRK